MKNKEVRGFYENSEDSEKTIQNKVMSFCEPSIDARIQWTAHNGKPLMLIRVEEGKTKPYIIRGDGIFVTIGDGDYHVSRAQLDAMYPPKESSHGTSLMTY